MEPETGLTILGTAIGGAKALEKLLGPTADYLGGGLREWTEVRVQNVRRIFEKAANRLGDKMERPGRVPPRLLKAILDDGSFCDDELAAEYYGGILASGRTETGRDDRAATYANLTSQLSTYQIRFHFVLHTVLRRIFVGSELRPNFASDRREMSVLLPMELLCEAMDFSPDEPPWEILVHCVQGLQSRQLIDALSWGRVAHLNDTGEKRFHERWQSVEHDGIIVAPADFGIEFFLWAMGFCTSDLQRFLQPELQLAEVPGIRIPDSARNVSGNAP